MNAASKNLPQHLGELRKRMLHPTDYELALNYFLEEFAGDTKFLDASEPDPHAPDEYRTNSVLQDLPEFAKSFSCKRADKMVSANPCRVW